MSGDAGNTLEELKRGRDAFGRRAWGDAYALLSEADRQVPLGPEDLERLAVSAFLLGKDSETQDAWSSAYHQLLNKGDTARAARCAFWLGLLAIQARDMARGGGWLGRAQELVDQGPDCVERGYLLVPSGLQNLRGDPAAAEDFFTQAAEIGDRFRDRDLMTLGRLGRGQALVAQGEAATAMAFIDEAIVAVGAGEVSPIVAGIALCGALNACQETLDLRRAREWTVTLTHWCASQPDMVPFQGQCLVHRAEIMRLRGDWPDATDAARQASERSMELPGDPAAGAAFYQQAELSRLRGEFAKAEEEYRHASQWGKDPQPGLAQLRLAQGRVEAAQSAIRRVVDESRNRLARTKVLPAYVEIMLEAGDSRAARAGADELSEIATALDAPLLHAVSAQSQGAVLLAEGDARAALDVLRRAWKEWRELGVPYEGARVRVLIGLACRALGDHDTAEMELDAVRGVFQRLGALPDLARAEDLSRMPTPSADGGLTGREVQVLSLMAAGKTNREIASELFISERTVARHVSNIFTKLGLSNRAAATAYAYQHDLV